MRSYQNAVNSIVETTGKYKKLLKSIGKHKNHEWINIGFFSVRYYQDGNYLSLSICLNSQKPVKIDISSHSGDVNIVLKSGMIEDISRIKNFASVFAKSFDKYVESISKNKAAKKTSLQDQLNNKIEEMEELKKELANLD